VEADHVLRGGCFVEDRVDPDAVLVESPGHGDTGGTLDGRWFDRNRRGGSPAGFGIGGRDGGRDGLRWVGNADRVYTFVDENDSALIGLGGGKLSGFADALGRIISRGYDDRGLHGASDDEAMVGIEECESVVGGRVLPEIVRTLDADEAVFAGNGGCSCRNDLAGQELAGCGGQQRSGGKLNEGATIQPVQGVSSLL